jgi:hypothetical protein
MTAKKTTKKTTGKKPEKKAEPSGMAGVLAKKAAAAQAKTGVYDPAGSHDKKDGAPGGRSAPPSQAARRTSTRGR